MEKIRITIDGMHCAACEVLIERKLKKIPGVESVRVDQARGNAELRCSAEPSLEALRDAVASDGYRIAWQNDGHRANTALARPNATTDYLEIAVTFLVIIAAYLVMKRFDLVPNLGISENMSYGFVFLIGLVAATSTCIAVSGGLLLAIAGKYNEQHPTLTRLQKFKPHIYFNAGRIVSYAAFGGAIGAIGSVLTLSSKANGILTIIASAVMILLGFQLLRIFPSLGRFRPTIPKSITHAIHDLSERHTRGGAFVLGASTFFLPCGFTQALQLYALSTGSAIHGALTMLAFSLGTLPALLSVSIISSFAKGTAQKHFLRFSGALVIILGLFNVNNGLALTGSNLNLWTVFASQGRVSQHAGAPATIVDGRQIIKMKISGLEYYPSHFTVTQGIPVEWQIDGSEAQGCAQVLTVPSLDITEYVPPVGIKTISFTPRDAGDIPFSCTMGMTTRGAAFTVVSNTTGIVAAPDAGNSQGTASKNCNPDLSDCVPAQKLSMEVTAERGFYPAEFIVKKGVPVEVAIDVKTPLGGCMSVMVVPLYQVTLPLKLGMNTLAFTPTEEGVVQATCSMGIPMVQFVVQS